MTRSGLVQVGQRFLQDDGNDQEQIVTVARVEEDPFGLDRVVFLMPDGREVTTYTVQIEAAMADGALAPEAELLIAS